MLEPLLSHFAKIAHKVAKSKFKYLAKNIISTESPDHVL